jgi:hypothetical protein
VTIDWPKSHHVVSENRRNYHFNWQHSSMPITGIYTSLLNHSCVGKGEFDSRMWPLGADLTPTLGHSHVAKCRFYSHTWPFMHVGKCLSVDLIPTLSQTHVASEDLIPTHTWPFTCGQVGIWPPLSHSHVGKSEFNSHSATHIPVKSGFGLDLTVHMWVSLVLAPT